MVFTNPNEWTLEELQIMHKAIGVEFEINDGAINKYKIGE